MLKRIIYLLLFIQPFFALSQDEEYTVMSFDQYIQRVKDHHPLSRQAEISVELGAAYLKKSRGAFDPTLSGSANQKYFNDDQYYSILNGKLNIPTWYGVSIESGYDLNNGVYLNPERNLPDEGLWYAGVKLSLGKGLIIDERRAEYKKARIFLESSVQQQFQMLNDLYLNASIAYWEWFKAYNKVLVYKEAVENATVRFESVRQSAYLGDKPFIDTLEANIQLQNRLFKLLDAELEFANNTELLEIYMWDQGFIPIELDSTVIAPKLVDITVNNIDAELALQVDSLKQFHPELLAAQYKIDQKQVDLQLSRNNLLPEMNFKYNAITHSNNGDLINNYSINNYTWGANVKIPLFLRKERGELKVNKLKLESLRNDLAFKTESVEYKIQSSLNAWTTSYQQILIWENATQNYARLLDSERVLFNIGESSLFMVNSREKAYIQAQIDLINTTINNKKAELKAKYAFGIIHSNL
jgi:outer membrane protein TolC